MNRSSRAVAALVLASASFAFAPLASADEAAIRKNISERLPNFPAIDEVTKSSIPGLYELRVGTDIFYTDEQGNYLIEGQMIDTKSRVNLTEQRIAKLTAIDFKALPLKDAMVWKQGTGERKLVVFADPNCGYCKKFEKDLQAVKDVTVYTFLYPILGGDSPRSRSRSGARRTTPRPGATGCSTAPRSRQPACDVSALQRNYAFGRSTASAARPGWCSRTAASRPARSTPSRSKSSSSRRARRARAEQLGARAGRRYIR
jgi:thiol:disulfide interchange protein DsbC